MWIVESCTHSMKRLKRPTSESVYLQGDVKFSKLSISMTYPGWYHVKGHGQSVPKMGGGLDLIHSYWPPKLVEA